MATVTSPTRKMPKTVLRKLHRMRSKLTQWILVHGLGRWLAVVIAILAFDMLVDRLFKMDFAQRLVMLAVMIGAMAAYFVWRVVKPLLSRPTDDALIYEVESKHPELKESLISGVQLSRQDDLESFGVSRELAQATIDRGLSSAQAIDFGKSLDLSRHFQNWMLLFGGLLVMVVLGWGVTKNEFLRTWYHRNILLMDDQWPQATYLEIAGATDGKMVLPRGSDHRQLVTIREDSTETAVSVSLEIDNPGGRTMHQMKPSGKLGGREHAFMFHNVSSPFRFRASGGDDVTEWVEVTLVEPPNIIDLNLAALQPEYTGIESLELNGMGPHSVLVGSRLKMAITTNKPLTRANVKQGDESFPMKMMGNDQQYELTLPDGGGQLRGGDYEFELVDQSGLASNRRSKFKITVKEDDVPKVRASLLGISGLVSARAILPTSYQAADSYGLSQLSFDTNWKTGVNEQTPGRRDQVFAELGTDDAGLPIRQVKDYAELDLIPFKLTPGTSFRFSVAARDNQPGTANVGRSQEFLLRVVSDEELRADLLRREIEQRKAFDDQAYQVQMSLMTEVQAIAVMTPGPDIGQEDFDAQREAALIGLIRKQKGVGTAMDRVANRFEEFLVEVTNNRLHEAENQLAPDQRIETRFDERIIQPIRRLDAEWVSLASRHLDNTRRAVGSTEELGQAIAQTVEVQQQIIAEMKRILSAMADSESFQEIINDFLEVKKDTTEIKGGIKNQMKPKDDVFEDEDVFDK